MGPGVRSHHIMKAQVSLHTLSGSDHYHHLSVSPSGSPEIPSYLHFTIRGELNNLGLSTHVSHNCRKQTATGMVQK